jgi:pimeloyl-ACP methyl ester carboxylesterase
MKGFQPINRVTAATVSRRHFLGSALAMALPPLLATQVVAQRTSANNFVANRDCSVRLPDGRRLAYADYGDPAATCIVLHHHGIPGCRIEAEFFRDALQRRPGVRVIATDRPGFGQSDPNPRISYQTWPADMVALTDALNIPCFSVMAYSAGTPYALATAAAMPERVRVVSLGCPVAPFEAVDTSRAIAAKTGANALHHPWACRTLFSQLVASFRRHPDRLPVLASLQSFNMGPTDRAFLNDPADRNLYFQLVDESFRQGTAEVVHAISLMEDPWASWLKDVRTKVKILQGNDDHVVRPGMAGRLAEMLPNAEIRFLANEGHLTLQRRYAAEVLAAALT